MLIIPHEININSTNLSILRIVNDPAYGSAPSQYLFKVQSNQPLKFGVSPLNGIIEMGEAIDIALQLKSGVASNTDKFLIMYIQLPHNKDGLNLQSGGTDFASQWRALSSKNEVKKWLVDCIPQVAITKDSSLAIPSVHDTGKKDVGSKKPVEADRYRETEKENAASFLGGRLNNKEAELLSLIVGGSSASVASGTPTRGSNKPKGGDGAIDIKTVVVSTHSLSHSKAGGMETLDGSTSTTITHGREEEAGRVDTERDVKLTPSAHTMDLLIKNLSKKVSNRLSEGELLELKSLRDSMSDVQWQEWMDLAQALKQKQRSHSRKSSEASSPTTGTPTNRFSTNNPTAIAVDFNGVATKLNSTVSAVLHSESDGISGSGIGGDSKSASFQSARLVSNSFATSDDVPILSSRLQAVPAPAPLAGTQNSFPSHGDMGYSDSFTAGTSISTDDDPPFQTIGRSPIPQQSRSIVVGGRKLPAAILRMQLTSSLGAFGGSVESDRLSTGEGGSLSDRRDSASVPNSPKKYQSKVAAASDWFGGGGNSSGNSAVTSPSNMTRPRLHRPKSAPRSRIKSGNESPSSNSSVSDPSEETMHTSRSSTPTLSSQYMYPNNTRKNPAKNASVAPSGSKSPSKAAQSPSKSKPSSYNSGMKKIPSTSNLSTTSSVESGGKAASVASETTYSSTASGDLPNHIPMSINIPPLDTEIEYDSPAGTTAALPSSMPFVIEVGNMMAEIHDSLDYLLKVQWKQVRYTESKARTDISRFGKFSDMNVGVSTSTPQRTNWLDSLLLNDGNGVASEEGNTSPRKRKRRGLENPQSQQEQREAASFITKDGVDILKNKLNELVRSYSREKNVLYGLLDYLHNKIEYVTGRVQKLESFQNKVGVKKYFNVEIEKCKAALDLLRSTVVTYVADSSSDFRALTKGVEEIHHTRKDRRTHCATFNSQYIFVCKYTEKSNVSAGKSTFKMQSPNELVCTLSESSATTKVYKYDSIFSSNTEGSSEGNTVHIPSRGGDNVSSLWSNNIHMLFEGASVCNFCFTEDKSVLLGSPEECGLIDDAVFEIFNARKQVDCKEGVFVSIIGLLPGATAPVDFLVGDIMSGLPKTSSITAVTPTNSTMIKLRNASDFGRIHAMVDVRQREKSGNNPLVKFNLIFTFWVKHQGKRGTLTFCDVSNNNNETELRIIKECLFALKRRSSFVPYRSSPLTNCLKDNLHFQTKVVLITSVTNNQPITMMGKPTDTIRVLKFFDSMYSCLKSVSTATPTGATSDEDDSSTFTGNNVEVIDDSNIYSSVERNGEGRGRSPSLTTLNHSMINKLSSNLKT